MSLLRPDVIKQHKPNQTERVQISILIKLGVHYEQQIPSLKLTARSKCVIP